ncbi:uncharacterized protein LOC8260577 [Ricinus communis]|uniref:Synechocystis YCF37 n=1 Tax=Ricinus communis TaxID=3988 RepID=B9S8R2_RICCO|nr:uncharacterized protein LOC8260577 [Ricinus communis]EEF40065.1 conserved hypothetical protein [Ricinus communis]|eukprot:XP_002522381.1 uncharacterized protein LOC8260577 [Ricinus communis]
MPSTISLPTVQALSLNNRARRAHAPSCNAEIPQSAFTGRRQLLFILTAAPALTVRETASKAEDIPLFGLRKKLKKAEEEAEELVREGFETAEKGLETAEKGIETAEKGIEAAEKEIEEAVSFGALAQAGAVAGAEIFGVLVATSVVNGILGPEAQRS